MQQHPSNLPLSLALAGRGFVMGVCMGLSGVVLDPIRGKRYSALLKDEVVKVSIFTFLAVFFEDKWNCAGGPAGEHLALLTICVKVSFSSNNFFISLPIYFILPHIVA